MLKTYFPPRNLKALLLAKKTEQYFLYDISVTISEAVYHEIKSSESIAVITHSLDLHPLKRQYFFNPVELLIFSQCYSND